MIYFICSKPNQQLIIEELIDSIAAGSELRFTDATRGTIFLDKKDISSFQLLTQQLQAEGPFTLTMLQSVNNEKLSNKVLDYQHQLFSGSYRDLNELLIIAMNQQNQDILSEFVNFYNSLPPEHLEFAKELIKNGGNVVKTAASLYFHRNTITNRLQQFENLTNLDLRDDNHRLLLRLLDIYIHNVRDAQDN